MRRAGITGIRDERIEGGPSVFVLRSLGEGGCSAKVPVEMCATKWQGGETLHHRS